MNETQEKYNLFNPHPVETRKYSFCDMRECWVAARENLVRWGVGEYDKPDFSSWVKEKFAENANDLTTPKQYPTIPELIAENEEELKLHSCPQCGEDAYDKYICHNCGFKEI